MKVQLSGTRNGQDWPARGSEIDLPDAEAVGYIDAGMAEPVTTFPAPAETATPPAKEERRAGRSGLTKANVPIP
jgi:hypothetical protein